MGDIEDVRKKAARQVAEDEAATKAGASELAAEHATGRREGAEAEQRKAAKLTAEAEVAGQSSVDDARAAEKDAKKTAAEDKRGKAQPRG